MILLLVLPWRTPAQEIYTLRDLVVIAMQENYQLQIVRNRERMAENLNTPGHAGMLPTIGVAADHNTDVMTSRARLYTGMERTGTNAISTRSGAAAELSWTVFDGFTMFARRDRLGHLAAMGTADTRFYIEQTINDLAGSYHLLVMETALLDVYRRISEVSALRLALEEQKKTIGAGNALQYNQALLDYHADSALVMQQSLRITEQQLRIGKILNRPAGIFVYPSDTALIAKGLPPGEHLLELAIRNNPELDKARLEEMVAEANSRIARGERYPQVHLFSSYAFGHQTSETGIIETATQRGAQFGVRVRFNLYDGGRQNTLMQNAAIARESSALITSEFRVALEYELGILTARYQNLAQQQKMLSESREAAAQSLDIAAEQLRAGAISGFEFRFTQLSVLRLQQQLIEITHALVSIETDIGRICGVLTENILNNTL
jgi:outer membrane protein TolC